MSPETKAGLLVTAIIHLAVIIVLLSVQLGYAIQRENSFVLDFTKQEEKEAAEKKEKLVKSAEELLEQLLAQSGYGAPVRNIAVDRAALKDDRGTDAQKLYEDAERLARELKDGQNIPDESPDDYVNVPSVKKDTPEKKKEVYTGPSVLEWSLDGRKASLLKIPAYRCLGAGEVRVIITVNNQGSVVDAKIDESVSSMDNCLREFAVRAARLSRFSVSQTAPSNQKGTITYLFIAQ
ncbi:MAG: energy transducer TonB [Bacteroidales bacterium]|nr:energy transducer TonB [Bacteroidales bacterium]